LSTCSGAILDIVTIGTMRLRSAIAGSAKAAVVFAMVTLKPLVSSRPATIRAHRSGSWPSQPPQTISAWFMMLSFVRVHSLAVVLSDVKDLAVARPVGHVERSETSPRHGVSARGRSLAALGMTG
jgi:hypothetical protein